MNRTTLLIILSIAAFLMLVLVVRALRSATPTAPAPRRAPKKRGGTTSKEPGPRPKSGEQPPAALPSLRKVHFEEDDDLELTKVSLPALDLDDEPTDTGAAAQNAVVPILYDDDAADDVPTALNAFILVSAVGETDIGRKRRRNEDSWIRLDDPPVFIVADGMGGHLGGDVASSLCVATIADTFSGDKMKRTHTSVPPRADEVVQAIQAANRAVFEEAQRNRELREMGTTVVCARFSPNKQRVYIGHVGDSRCYILRNGKLHQITTDHTAATLGVQGPMGHILIRALGVKKHIVVDLIIGRPRIGDRYLLCTDGLTKMLDAQSIEGVMTRSEHPQAQVDSLIAAANEAGGHDNVTAVIIRVDPVSAPPPPQPQPA